MSDGHKAAIAAGRIEAAAVRDYLEALESNKPRRGRAVSPQRLAENLANARAQLEAGEANVMKRLQLMQEVADLESRIAEAESQPDIAAAEEGFVVHGANYGKRKGIEYATWRGFGVPAEVLAKAGITRS